MIRITAGIYKNKKLNVPKVSRPLTDRIRISMFELIRDFIPGATILDLYAGSGVTGYEALSRGGKTCLFIDNSEESIEIIKENKYVLDLDNTSVNIIKSSVERFLQNNELHFDIIFLDPPFDEIFKLNITKLVSFLNVDGVVVARLPKDFTKKQKHKLSISNEVEEVYKKSYGQSEVVFYKRKV
ncbi:16S rRNA (guanine(966)-N(2))-methyltransferase RsmD [Candidatus Dojkabacteria bacterium]|uniref:16S rRNA (Guanine(966)-N(2))-methyltransferase RsmD n=1 Tax=Candidatus Dojkabacteria bacterium TaxID=2099670 RepID=A0A955L7C2_9BACT|nr:16S rRNA (guanine(966)-N(2))-methyltransferase RsmD [Candidatus Dojkabacteria bacterium]